MTTTKLLAYNVPAEYHKYITDVAWQQRKTKSQFLREAVEEKLDRDSRPTETVDQVIAKVAEHLELTWSVPAHDVFVDQATQAVHMVLDAIGSDLSELSR